MEEIKEIRTILDTLQKQLDKLEAKVVKPIAKAKYILDKDVKKVRIFKNGKQLRIVNNVLIVGDETKNLFVEKNINCLPTNADIRKCFLYVFMNNNILHTEFSRINPKNIRDICLIDNYNRNFYLWTNNY